MEIRNGSDRFFSGTVTSMANTELPKEMVEDRTFARCPGHQCESKVVIYDGDKVNYCCGPCWAATWAEVRQAPEDMPDKPHSTECVWRQERRKSEPVVEGTFTVIAASTPQPSRL
jgi:hypothetical protein